MEKPVYVPRITCPKCDSDDAVALEDGDTLLIWCEHGHIVVVGPDERGGLIHTL